MDEGFLIGTCQWCGFSYEKERVDAGAPEHECREPEELVASRPLP